MTDWALGTITLLLLGAEWRWRLGILRLLVSLGAALLIFAARDLGPASRRALETKAPVTTLGGKGVTPYASGVLTMKREAQTGLGFLVGSVTALVWLSLSPLLPPVGRRPSRWRSSGGTG
jgi:hypothetical protein